MMTRSSAKPRKCWARFSLPRRSGAGGWSKPRARSSALPAGDSPDPGGLSAAELTGLLAALAPRAVGAQVTVFDPDLDPDGSHARLLTDILVTGLAPLSRDRR